MATQTTISQFFTSRKRAATEELKRGVRNKLLKIEDCAEYKKVKVQEAKKLDILPSSPHYNPKKTPQFNSLRQVVKCERSQSAEKVKKRLFEPSKSNEEEEAAQEKNEQKTVELVPIKTEDEVISNSDIKQEVKLEEPVEIKKETTEDQVAEQAQPSSSKPTSTFEKCTSVVKGNKSSLKKKLTRSGHLAAIKQALGDLSKKISDLTSPKKTEEVKPKIPPSPGTLSKFDSLQVEVITSPVKSASIAMREVDAMVAAAPGNLPSLRKNLFRSPAKPSTQPQTYASPRKLMLEKVKEGVTVSAHERFAALACSSGRAALPLPVSYRTLGEHFRAFDAVSAMIAARNDTITFTALKPSVERITCKTLTVNHLGQMLTVLPGAFQLEYKGSNSKKQLVVTPPAGEGGVVLAPAQQLERKRAFYNKLISITKDHHQAFLEKLDPPLIVDKEKVTRWHPHFDIDGVPAIPVSELLPTPPAASSAPTAASVLEGAREMLFANDRMRAALGKLNSLHSSNPEQPVTPAAAAVPALTETLSKIPKSLLEKIRAKEAAKAAAMLTQAPEARQQALRIQRLPAIARIIRNLYVSERRNVIARPHVLDKIVSSYPDSLSAKDLDAHLSLIVQKAPNWLSINKFDNIEYIRMDKTVDINKLDFSQ